MTYPPSGNDQYGQQPPGEQPPTYDPYAAPQPPTYSDPTSPPPAAPAYPDPAAAQPPVNPYASGAPYGQPDPYAQQAPYGQPDPYAAQAPYGQPAAPYAYGPQSGKTNGLAIAALSTGVASILLACCCSELGIIVGVLGVVFGVIGKKQIKERGEKGDGMALAGLITGAIGGALCLIRFILGLWNVGGTDWMNNF